MGCGGSKSIKTIEPNSSHEETARLSKLGSIRSGGGDLSLADVIYEAVNHNALALDKYYKNQMPPPKNATDFIDDLFPPNLDSVFGRKKGANTDPYEERRQEYFKDFNIKEEDVVWLRAKDIFDNGVYSVFEGSIAIDDINQGSIGDCYFLAAISALSEYPQLIAQIFRTLSVPDNACFEIALRINGVWKVVLLDDYFPCDKSNNKPVFCKPQGAEIWTMLLEKASAKINGGYLNIVGGWSTEVLGTLTSFPLEYISHTHFESEDSQNQMWTKIRDADKNDFILSASSKVGYNFEKKFGLVPGHAFTLMSAVEGAVGGVLYKLVKLRNPWGYREWKGDWSDDSGRWTPEAIKVFGFNEGKKDDGIFWMSFADFLKFFDATEICKVFSPDASVSIQIPKDRIDSYNVYDLHLPKNADVDISIIRKNYRFNRKIVPDDEVVTNIIVVKKENGQLIYMDSASEGPSNATLNVELKAGNYLVYFHVDYRTGVYDKKRKYVLYVSCDNIFSISDRGTDDDSLSLLKEIMSSHIKRTKFKEMQESYVQVVQNSFENTCWGYLYFWNKTSDHYKVKGSTSHLSNMILVTKFDGEVVIPVNNEWICVANRVKKYPGQFVFSLKYENTFTDSTDNSECINVSETVRKKIQSLEDDNYSHAKDFDYDFVFNRVYYDLNSVIQRIDPFETAIKMLEKKYPTEMAQLLAMPPLSTEKLKFRQYNWGDALYIGEWGGKDFTMRKGRGMYIWDNGNKFIGYYENNNMEGPGKFTSSKGQVMEFTFVNGKQHGIGYVTEPAGERQQAEYANGNFVKWL